MYFSTVLEPASHNKDLLFHLIDLGFNLLKIITNVQTIERCINNKEAIFTNWSF